jgi:hypothetical protein
MLRNYRVAAQLVASRVVLSSTESVSYILLYLFNAGTVGRLVFIFSPCRKDPNSNPNEVSDFFLFT